MVSSSTITSNIWNLFYNRLNTGVTSVTLDDSSTSTIQRYSASYSNEVFDDNSDFPMLIIEDPTFDNNPETFTKEKSIGSIIVEVYTTSAQSASKFADAILNSINTYRHELAVEGLKKVRGNLIDIDSAKPGAFMVHVRRMRFNFEYTYDKESGF